MLQQLVKQFSTLAFSLCPFTSDDQRIFLMNFWEKIPNRPDNFSTFVSSLMNLWESSHNDNLNELTGIPLQSRMLAEVFHEDAAHFCSTGKVRLPECLNLIMLYDQFVFKKCKEHFDKFGVNVSEKGCRVLQDYQHNYQQSLMYCALVSYLHPEHIRELNHSEIVLFQNKQFVDRFKSAQDNIGIVVRLAGEKAVFLHSTFTEYFIALYFSEYFSFQLGFIEKIYMNEDFKVIQKFLDRILAKERKLHTSVINQNLSEVQNLVSQGSIEVNLRDAGGRTALHLAILNMNTFFHTDQKCLYGYFLYKDECYDDNYKILKTLLDHGAVVDCEEDQVLHCKPLQLAEKIKAWRVVAMLLESQDDDKLIGWIRDNIEKEEVGGECESRMSESLHNVAFVSLDDGNMNVVKSILNCGVSVHHTMRDNNDTMLSIVAMNGHVELAQLLISHCANDDEKQVYVNKIYEDGITALYLAAGLGEYEIAELLLKHGALVDVCGGYENRTPLMRAAEENQLTLAELLVQHGACVNANGQTALFLAAQTGYYDMVELLIQLGADANICDNVNRTPLMMALKRDLKGVIQVLRRNKASENATN
ncbi:hypothetical protein L9F63_001647 [Diploptera punctata]|uniref:Ankyrin repeat protein n=1 Tax=Diploptera punctata TaxID=6984 RepID=A0AAD8A370_DIPPU|nr:hypothetical protein L9F63_001647 [Diploptera punctata]